jgi:hypothetical protein
MEGTMMKKSTKNFVLASLLSAGGAVLLTAAYRKSQRDVIRFLEDTDMRNSAKMDQMESVDAGIDPAEKGLTQLDSAMRAEWIANGFPQTHMEMEELAKETDVENNTNYAPM